MNLIVGIRMSEGLRSALTLEAEAVNRSLSDYIRLILIDRANTDTGKDAQRRVGDHLNSEARRAGR